MTYELDLTKAASKDALQARLEYEISLRQHFQALAESKNLFLANMSHEIRTPLGLILGFTEELIQSSELTPANKYLIQTIQRNSEMLARLINDILDFCKIEAGLLDFDINEIQTVHFLEEMDTIFNSKCAQKRRPFQIEILTPLPDTFCSDEMRIKQILLNLLCNALKHTEDGPLILKISYDEKLSLFYFEVIDTGGGILAHQQKDIFEKFKQLHKDKPGSGLGLPLSLNLARGLQGDLILKYSEAHKGSCFQASIKNQQPPVKLGVEARCHNADALMPCLKGRRLMIVDDLADNIRLLECILGPTEAFIDSTTSVQVALKKFQTSSFDLILLDLIMPEMDGFQALDLFRSAGFSGEVWAVSANAMKTQKKDCLKAGFSQHISKPIQRKGFYKKLQQWVDTK